MLYLIAGWTWPGLTALMYSAVPFCLAVNNLLVKDCEIVRAAQIARAGSLLCARPRHLVPTILDVLSLRTFTSFAVRRPAAAA